MSQEVYEYIDSRINTINFELNNYDSDFVLKSISKHLKGSFKYVYFNEKKKELEFLRNMVALMQEEEEEENDEH